MRFICRSALIAFLGFISACSTPVKYSSDYQTSYNFDQVKSFAWYTKDDSSHKGNDLIKSRIKSTVEQQLKEKGFVMTSEADADFYVNYGITTEKVLDIQQYNTYSGYATGFRYYPWGTGLYPRGVYGYQRYDGTPETRVTQHTEGTLVLDMIEAKSDKIIWRGSATGHLKNQELPAKERDALVDEVITGVLSEFPPK